MKYSKREPIQEEITNNSSELLQMVKELRTYMEAIKKENERILRAQEDVAVGETTVSKRPSRRFESISGSIIRTKSKVERVRIINKY